MNPFINYFNGNEENIIELFNEEFKYVPDNIEINTSANVINLKKNLRKALCEYVL